MDPPDPNTLPNPYTPLAFLPPEIADQYQILGYVYVATLAAYGWDWLMSLPEELRVLRKSGLSCPNITYALSRIGTLGYLISTAVFTVASVSGCQALLYCLGIFFIISISSTSLLFFFRLRAVFNQSKIVVYFFGFLWVSILGLSPLYMTSLKGSQIPFTARCNVTFEATYSSVPLLLATINDTLLFLAISYRLIMTSMTETTWTARLHSFVRGDGLHSVSKSLLQSGQVYYFVTIGLSLTVCVMILSNRVPPEMHSLLGPSYVALSSAMACRVFRMVVLGVIKDTTLSTTRIASAVAKARSGSGLDSHARTDSGVHVHKTDNEHGFGAHDVPLKNRPLGDPNNGGLVFEVMDIAATASDYLGTDSKGQSFGTVYSSDVAGQV